MPIRIVHTADNHIGLPFKAFEGVPALRAKLIGERFAALGRLVDEANTRGADFFVVAGDLFDTTRVTKEDITKTVGILNGFAGVAVIVVPGNHDSFSGPETDVWKRFRDAVEAAGASQIDLLTVPAVKTYEVGDAKVSFFPCPCPSKTGREPTIGWVADAARDHADALRIGIAHGNVTGLGLDAEGHYFTMTPDDLQAAGVATWLLGHIHVPFPPERSGTQSPYFMAGMHTPDSVRCRHAGSAWWIECDGGTVTGYERLAPGAIRFVRLERELSSADDVAALLAECQRLAAHSTVLDLQLSGRLAASERTVLDDRLREIEREFLHTSVEQEFHEPLDAAMVEATYRRGGLAARLLTALLADSDHPDAATLAHELLSEAARR
jgi:DNA repair exonuclease SbcCD nuclease subunit